MVHDGRGLLALGVRRVAAFAHRCAALPASMHGRTQCVRRDREELRGACWLRAEVVGNPQAV